MECWTPQWFGIVKPRNVEIKCHLDRNITPLKTNMSSKKVPFQKESNLFFRVHFSFRGSQEIQITTTNHQFEALVELFHHRPYKHDISKLYTSDYSPWQGINTPNQKVYSSNHDFSAGLTFEGIELERFENGNNVLNKSSEVTHRQLRRRQNTLTFITSTICMLQKNEHI